MATDAVPFPSSLGRASAILLEPGRIHRADVGHWEASLPNGGSVFGLNFRVLKWITVPLQLQRYCLHLTSLKRTGVLRHLLYLYYMNHCLSVNSSFFTNMHLYPRSGVFFPGHDSFFHLVGAEKGP